MRSIAVAGQRLLVRRGSRRGRAPRCNRAPAPSPIAPEISGVPASNRCGGSWNVGLLERDVEDHVAAGLPGRHRLQQLVACRTARRCRSGHKSCGRRRHRNRNRARGTSTGMRGTAWQPSTSTLAPLACASSTMRSTGTHRAGHVRRHASPRPCLVRGVSIASRLREIEPAGRIDRRDDAACSRRDRAAAATARYWSDARDR